MSTALEPAVTSVAAGRALEARHAYLLSWALVVAAAVTAGLTFFVPDVLTGPAVTNANARGTALVMLVVAVPLLAASIRESARGSWRWPVVWLGAVAYLLYNSFLFLFLTPFNSLFLFYVTTFGLSVFAAIALLRATDIDGVARSLGDLPVRGLAVYLWTVVGLNTLLWLRAVVPVMLGDEPATLMEGTAVATNAIYVEDLAFWFPLMLVTAWWLWHRRPWAIVVSGGYLVYAVIEAIGVATDQWFGHRADPASSLASQAGAVLFAALAVIGLVPLYFYFRNAGESAPGIRRGPGT